MPRRVVLLALGAAVLAWEAPAACAMPSLKLSVRSLPVEGAPHTGDIAGAPATLSIQLRLAGSEYGGYPPPIAHLAFSLAPGVSWSTRAFNPCEESPREPRAAGPSGCPIGAEVKEAGHTTGGVAFGPSYLPENGQIVTYYNNKEGGIGLVLLGRTPVLFEMNQLGTVSPVIAARGPRFEFELPEAETVIGANLITFTSFTLLLGSSNRSSAHPAFSLHMPARCPRRGLRFTAEVGFMAVAGLPAQTARASYRARCPRPAGRARRPR